MKTKLVYGVGRNDAAYPVHSTKTAGGLQKSIWSCPFYEVWKNMLRRCYSKKFHERYPTYVGCTVAPEWLSFSVFMEWMSLQLWNGMHLDKDILIPGNKVYGSETCIFVHPSLNNFLTDASASRGKYSLGVTTSPGSRSFISRCNNPFTGLTESLGYFPDEKSAANAYRMRKHQHACTYADMQSDPRVAAALRTRYFIDSNAA